MSIPNMESPKVHPRPRRTRQRPMHDQYFASYLSFGFKTTVVIGIFLGVYVLVLVCLSPLLYTTLNGTNGVPTKRGEALKPALEPLFEKVKHFKPHVPGQMYAEGIAKDIKTRLVKYRKQEGFSDASLMKKAAADISQLRQRRSDVFRDEDTTSALAPAKAASGQRSGFVVLGMHRSGTSMMSGLLVNGMGYKTGGPLIGSAFDNEKGFFELLPVVLQNDEFMKKQRVWWSSSVLKYDAEKGLEDKNSGKVDFTKGDRALKFLNNEKNGPWLQKDPRMCITLKTWLPLLTNEPAAVFTYRHPLEVALSLKKREKHFSLERGLRLWIMYNMGALQNSAGLCRVLSSNEAVLADPLTEVQRIADELTKCGVPEPPQKLTKDDVDKFVDPALQHNKKEREDKAVITEINGCVIREYESSERKGSAASLREHDLYLQAMKIYCDFKSGAAFKDDYEWPELD